MPNSAAAGGPRSVFELAVESLRCPCCRERFYFAQHAGKVWRTECPNAACAQVLVVTREPSFRFRVERIGANLERRFPEAPRFLHYVAEHWIEVAFAVALLLALVPMLWASSSFAAEALPMLLVSFSAALACGIAFAWGATHWSRRRGRHDARRRDAARTLGRTPYVVVSATPGWYADS